MSFLAYGLQATLKARLKSTASGLTPRAVLEKFAAVQILDVPFDPFGRLRTYSRLRASRHLPTTDGREIIRARHTPPEKELQRLLDPLKLTLPAQPPPKITTPKTS